jgi:uncharacterized protein (DUF1697 family)
MRWAALLRGVNLGRRQLKSADLRALVEAAGYADARPLLASGNIVFTADEADPLAVERTLEAAVERAAGFASAVFVRDAAALDAAIAANPFPEVARDRPSQLVVVFHREPVDTAPLARLAETYSGPERLHAVGRELFIDYPEGQGRSKLEPAVMTRVGLPKVATARNWNTVLKVRGAL